MSNFQETVKAMKTEYDCQIHFSECWDEVYFLSEGEIIDWLEEMKRIIDSPIYTNQKKLQMIVDSVTGGDYNI